MVERQLRGRGIVDERVLAAMGEVPRERFVLPEDRAQAYDDTPLAIGYGQTISQPYIVALQLEQLGLRGDERLLEVGAGSGYAAGDRVASGARGRRDGAHRRARRPGRAGARGRRRGQRAGARGRRPARRRRRRAVRRDPRLRRGRALPGAALPRARRGRPDRRPGGRRPGPAPRARAPRSAGSARSPMVCRAASCRCSRVRPDSLGRQAAASILRHGAGRRSPRRARRR